MAPQGKAVPTRHPRVPCFLFHATSPALGLPDLRSIGSHRSVAPSGKRHPKSISVAKSRKPTTTREDGFEDGSATTARWRGEKRDVGDRDRRPRCRTVGTCDHCASGCRHQLWQSAIGRLVGAVVGTLLWDQPLVSGSDPGERLPRASFDASCRARFASPTDRIGSVGSIEKQLAAASRRNGSPPPRCSTHLVSGPGRGGRRGGAAGNL